MLRSEKQYFFKLCGGLPAFYDMAGYPKTIFYGFNDNPSSAAIIPAKSDSEATELLKCISELDEIWINRYNAQKAGHISMAEWYKDTANNWYHSHFIPYLKKYGEQFVPPSIRKKVSIFEEMCVKSGGILDVGRTAFTPLKWVWVPSGHNIGSSQYPDRTTDEMIVQSVSMEQFKQLCAKVIARENWSDQLIEYEFYSYGNGPWQFNTT
jgi:hypothetical protein